MVETPVGNPGESVTVVEVLLGVAPFVFLVGVVAGLAAALVVWPLAARLDAAPGTLDENPASYLRGPTLVGGVGLLASLVVDFARRTPPERVGLALAVRLLLVAACLSGTVHWLQYREAPEEMRRANGYAYAGFVGVWTSFALGLYALWL